MPKTKFLFIFNVGYVCSIKELFLKMFTRNAFFKIIRNVLISGSKKVCMVFSNVIQMEGRGILLKLVIKIVLLKSCRLLDI